VQIQIDEEYDWSDLRTACMTIKKGFFRDTEYTLENIIDLAKKYHHQRVIGWEGWIALGNDSPFKGR
jgi:hypothetical protein